MKSTYIAPCCIIETYESENMILSSKLDDSITTGAPDTDENIVLPGTTPGGSNPKPTDPDGPIELGSKRGGFFWKSDWSFDDDL